MVAIGAAPSAPRAPIQKYRAGSANAHRETTISTARANPAAPPKSHASAT
jgi:hypothetical protein